MKAHTASASLQSVTGICGINKEATAVKLWVKSTSAGSVIVNIMPDTAGWYKYTLNLTEANANWTEVTIPLAEIKTDDGKPFTESGYKSIWQVQFDLRPAAEADIYFDDVRFVTE